MTCLCDIHSFFQDIVRVVNERPKRHFGEYFIRHISRVSPTLGLYNPFFVLTIYV